MSDFYKVLEELRERKQISKQNLATRAGLAPSYVSHLTLGSRDNPSVETVDKLAHALDLDYEEKKRLFDAARLAFPSQSIAATPFSPISAYKQVGDIITEDWDNIPNVQALFGREDELEELRHWILQDRCQLVIVSGAGGIGKTMLTTKLARDIAGEFDYVFWRSLKDAPPFESIVEQFLLLLSNQQLLDPHLRLDERVRLLTDYLKAHRCLIILDNVEAILQEKEPAGEYREQDEEYGKLIDTIGETLHKSCLLLTTRELPKGIVLLAGKATPVRVYLLEGLKVKDGLKVLEDKGLHWAEQTGDAEKLVQRYAGNPLALKVAAQFIQDAFAGDISTFLTSSSSIFQDIQNVLEQQFGRLPLLEQQIMYWLAIEREAISPKDLLNEFASPPEVLTLADALQSLRRRSLIETYQAAFTLQPVILEFMTEKLVKQVVEEIGSESIGLIESHALRRAQAKEHIRDTQSRLILDPVAKQLLTTYGREECEAKLKAILHKLHKIALPQTGICSSQCTPLTDQVRV